MKSEKAPPPAIYSPDPLMRAPAPPLVPWTPPALSDASQLMPPPLPNHGVPMGPRMPPAPSPAYGAGGGTEMPRNGRIRVNRACLRCRSHKIKCTGAFPCSNCTKNNEECRFGKDEPPAKMRRARSPESSPTGGDAYTEYLESRVRYLESLSRRLMEEKAYDEGERPRPSRTRGGREYAPEAYDAPPQWERGDAAAKRARHTHRDAGHCMDADEHRCDTHDRERKDGSVDAADINCNCTDSYGRVVPVEEREYHDSSIAMRGAEHAVQQKGGTRRGAPGASGISGVAGAPGAVGAAGVAGTPGADGAHSADAADAADAADDAEAHASRAWSSSAKWRMVDRPSLALVTELCNSVYSGLSDNAKARVNVPRRQFFGWNMSGCHYLRSEPFPPEPDMSALSAQQRTAYVDYFFHDINPLFAILHETVFREQIRASDADDAATTNFTALFRAMLCLVYALSIRFTEFVRPQGPSLDMLRLEETLFRYGHRVVSIISFEWESFELIQCWLLITLYLRTTHRQTSAFTALGRAVHMCRVMGLGRPPRSPSVPQYEVLKARRIFECVYCFDRVVGYFGGRRRSFPAVDISRRVPSLDYEAESDRDDWITLPAFAMIHIGRVANLIPSGQRTEIRTAMIDRELTKLDAWLTAHGFGSADSIFTPAPGADAISPTVRAQVRFYYYDLVLAVHGQILFSILGRPVHTAGMRLDLVRAANSEIVRLAHGLSAHGSLYVPWHTTLNLVFNAGICALVLLQASVAVHEARGVLAGAMGILQQLQDSPVYEDGKMLFFERFKMVRECMWALKTANHIVSLGFTEAAQGLRDLGIDHGNPDVNRQYFGQFGLMDAPAESSLDKLAHDQSRRGFQDRQKVAARITAPTPESTFSQPTSLGYGGNEIIESLRWFDNWLDFGEAN